jgi:hypothetical protein
VAKKRAFQVDVEDKVIIRFRDFPERSVLLDSGVIDQDIQPTQRLDRFHHHSRSVPHFADVRLDGHCPASDFFHHLDGLRRCLRMSDIIDDNVGSFFSEPQRDRLSNSLVATRD